MSTLLLWLLTGVPALTGVALCIAGRRAQRVAVPVSLLTATVSVGLAFAAAFVRPVIDTPFTTGATFGLAVDGLSALMLPMISVVTLLVLIFAAAEGTHAPARFHGMMLLFSAAVFITATATTLPTLLFAWEIMGALSYALIGFHWRADERMSAGLTAFTVTRAGDLGLYIAAGAALAAGGGLELESLPSAGSPWRDVIAAGILVAALGKAAQLPFSFWLSRAMEGPSTVSALLHSAAMVAMGGYLLLRVEPLLASTGWASPTTAWIGAITALLLGAVAVGQRDLKQLLAASTAAQLGFVVLAAGVGSIAGGTTQLVAHASTKALLFLVAGAWLTALGTKRLSALQGAARRWPVIGIAFTVGALGLAGVAPLALWATKDGVLASALEANPALYVVSLAASALSAAYAGKVLFVVWAQPGSAQTEGAFEQEGSGRIGSWELVPLIVLAGGAAVLGLLALPPVGNGVRALLGAEAEPVPSVFELAGSAILTLVVLALVARRRLPEPAWAANWLGLERAAHVAVVAPVLFVSERLARFDDRVLDGAVTRLARATDRAASEAARIDIGGIDGAVEATARSARRLGRVARLPQSGQLHQYYVQIAVVLAAALVLLLVVR